MWNLLDAFFLPDDYLWSNLWSCVIGNIGCVLCLILQPFASKLSSYFDSGPFMIKLFIEDSFSLFSLTLYLFYWRGMWNTLVIIQPDLFYWSVEFSASGIWWLHALWDTQQSSVS